MTIHRSSLRLLVHAARLQRLPHSRLQVLAWLPVLKSRVIAVERNLLRSIWQHFTSRQVVLVAVSCSSTLATTAILVVRTSPYPLLRARRRPPIPLSGLARYPRTIPLLVPELSWCLPLTRSLHHQQHLQAAVTTCSTRLFFKERFLYVKRSKKQGSLSADVCGTVQSGKTLPRGGTVRC